MPPPSPYNLQLDTIVIGAGLSGLITGWRTSVGGKKTHIIAKGWGATYWGSGCIDVFGYHPSDYSKAIDSPYSFLEKLIASNPQHPYALVGLDRLAKAIKAFQLLCKESDYPLQGSLEANWFLPTALGTLRPTCLAPDTMVAGDARQRSPVLVVGFNQYMDFYPSLIADNLNAHYIFASDIMLDLTSFRDRKFISNMVLARLFDSPEFRQEVINALKPKLGRVARVGFPAVLGLQHPMQVKQHLESSLGIPVFEIPGLPPSIPGIRLHNLLVSALERNHGHIFNGMQAIGSSSDYKHITAIWSEAASRQKSHQAKIYVLATGGILGGGVVARENGYAQDTVFGIQVAVPDQRTRWFVNEFLSSGSQPIHKNGIRVDQVFHPIDQTDHLIYNNLYAVGSTLDGFDPIREHSLEGIALATGFSVGEILSDM